MALTLKRTVAVAEASSCEWTVRYPYNSPLLGEITFTSNGTCTPGETTTDLKSDSIWISKPPSLDSTSTMKVSTCDPRFSTISTKSVASPGITAWLLLSSSAETSWVITGGSSGIRNSTTPAKMLTIISAPSARATVGRPLCGAVLRSCFFPFRTRRGAISSLQRRFT